MPNNIYKCTKQQQQKLFINFNYKGEKRYYEQLELFFLVQLYYLFVMLSTASDCKKKIVGFFRVGNTFALTVLSSTLGQVILSYD